MKCEIWSEWCSSGDALVVKAMTAYPWDGGGEDPNRDRVLCANCAREYREYWSDMWAEYYAPRF